jgi:hypothetical protein
MDLEIIPVTEPVGAVTSNPVPIGVKTAIGIATGVGYASGAIKFNASTDNGVTWLQLCDSTGAPFTIATPPAASLIALPEAVFATCNVLQVVVASAPSVNLTLGLAVRAAF